MTQTLESQPAIEIHDPTDKYWSTEEYERLITAGLLEGARVQLIEGRIVETSPHYLQHSIAIELADAFVRVAFPGKRVRIQSPMKFKNDSQPEPDISVVEGNPRAAIDHPNSALLIIEIGEASIRFDQSVKSKIYAANGILDYWIVNLVDRKLEIYRDPAADAVPRYQSIQVFGATDRIAPLAAPDHSILVADLLP